MRKRVTARAALLAVIAGTCYADYVTGPDIGFSLFYLVPIAMSAWYLDRATALAAAGAASAGWLVAELAWGSADVAVVAWNGLTRVVIYTSHAFLLARVREDRMEMERILSHEKMLARTDSTTSLANSRAFIESLETRINPLLATGRPVAIIYIDLDNFKSINDTYGHSTGDHVLTRVGNLIRSLTSGDAVAARVGGDEFAILLPETTTAEANAFAKQILDGVGEIGRDYPDARLGMSAGIVICSGPQCQAEKLINSADAAMYQAKEQGKNRVLIRGY